MVVLGWLDGPRQLPHPGISADKGLEGAQLRPLGDQPSHNNGFVFQGWGLNPGPCMRWASSRPRRCILSPCSIYYLRAANLISKASEKEQNAVLFPEVGNYIKRV